MSYQRVILFVLIASLGYIIGPQLEPKARPIKNVDYVIDTEDLQTMALIFASQEAEAHVVRVLDSSTGKVRGPDLKLRGSVELSGDGNYVLSVDEQSAVNLFDVSTGKSVAQYPLGIDRDDLWTIRTSHNGELFCYVFNEKDQWRLQIAESKTGKALLNLYAEDPDCLSVTFGPKNEKVAISCGQTDRVELWKLGSRPQRLMHKRDTRFVASAAAGRWFCTPKYSAEKFLFYDFASCEQIRTLDVEEYDHYETSCDKGKRVLTHGHLGCSVWDLDTNKKILHSESEGDTALSRDGKALVCHDLEKAQLRIVSVDGGKQLLKRSISGDVGVVGFDHNKRKGLLWVYDFDSMVLTPYKYKHP